MGRLEFQEEEEFIVSAVTGVDIIMFGGDDTIHKYDWATFIGRNNSASMYKIVFLTFNSVYTISLLRLSRT